MVFPPEPPVAAMNRVERPAAVQGAPDFGAAQPNPAPAAASKNTRSGRRPLALVVKVRIGMVFAFEPSPFFIAIIP